MGIYSSTPFVDVFWIFVDPKILLMAFFSFSPSFLRKTQQKSTQKNPVSGWRQAIRRCLRSNTVFERNICFLMNWFKIRCVFSLLFTLPFWTSKCVQLWRESLTLKLNSEDKFGQVLTAIATSILSCAGERIPMFIQGRRWTMTFSLVWLQCETIGPAHLPLSICYLLNCPNFLY